MSQNSLDTILEKVLRLELRDQLRLNQIITLENKLVQLEITNFRLNQRVHDLETIVALNDIKNDHYDDNLGQNDIRMAQLEDQVQVLTTKCETINLAKEGRFQSIFDESRGGDDLQENSKNLEFAQMDDIEIEIGSNNSMEVNTNTSDLEFNENISEASSFSNPSVSTSGSSDTDDMKLPNLPIIFFPTDGHKKESSEDESDLTN